jgi:hypothetical protein
VLNGAQKMAQGEGGLTEPEKTAAREEEGPASMTTVVPLTIFYGRRVVDTSQAGTRRWRRVGDETTGGGVDVYRGSSGGRRG